MMNPVKVSRYKKKNNHKMCVKSSRQISSITVLEKKKNNHRMCSVSKKKGK